MPTVLESLELFLRARAPQLPGGDLMDRWNPNMETQVNVSGDGGEPMADNPRRFPLDGNVTVGVIEQAVRAYAEVA